VNSFGGKNFPDARTNALHVLNRGGKFEHAGDPVAQENVSRSG
jgi:hypothetical protein